MVGHTAGDGTVEGSRSPRFAFLKKMRIRNSRGEQYLFRLRLIDTPWFGVYLHHITGNDPQPIPHDHPWPFTSLVLWGEYAEDVFYPRGALIRSSRLYIKANTWGFGSVHRMPSAHVAHRIVAFAPNTWTLIFRGPRERDWGFWEMADGRFNGWVHWKNYEEGT